MNEITERMRKLSLTKRPEPTPAVTEEPTPIETIPDENIAVIAAYDPDNSIALNPPDDWQNSAEYLETYSEDVRHEHDEIIKRNDLAYEALARYLYGTGSQADMERTMTNGELAINQLRYYVNSTLQDKIDLKAKEEDAVYKNIINAKMRGNHAPAMSRKLKDGRRVVYNANPPTRALIEITREVLDDISVTHMMDIILDYYFEERIMKDPRLLSSIKKALLTKIKKNKAIAAERENKMRLFPNDKALMKEKELQEPLEEGYSFLYNLLKDIDENQRHLERMIEKALETHESETED